MNCEFITVLVWFYYKTYENIVLILYAPRKELSPSKNMFKVSHNNLRMVLLERGSLGATEPWPNISLWFVERNDW